MKQVARGGDNNCPLLKTNVGIQTEETTFLGKVHVLSMNSLKKKNERWVTSYATVEISSTLIFTGAPCHLSWNPRYGGL